MKREPKKAHSIHIINIFESNSAKQINKRASGYIIPLKNDIVGINQDKTRQADVVTSGLLLLYSKVMLSSLNISTLAAG